MRRKGYRSLWPNSLRGQWPSHRPSLSLFMSVLGPLFFSDSHLPSPRLARLRSYPSISRLLILSLLGLGSRAMGRWDGRGSPVPTLWTGQDLPEAPLSAGDAKAASARASRSQDHEPCGELTLRGGGSRIVLGFLFPGNGFSGGDGAEVALCVCAGAVGVGPEDPPAGLFAGAGSEREGGRVPWAGLGCRLPGSRSSRPSPPDLGPLPLGLLRAFSSVLCFLAFPMIW